MRSPSRTTCAVALAAVFTAACANGITSLESDLASADNDAAPGGSVVSSNPSDAAAHSPGADAARGGGGGANGQDDGGAEVDAAAGDAAQTGTGDGAPPADANPGSSVPPPVAGELVITEVMYDPSGTEPGEEWFELHNEASAARLLSGLVLLDGGGRTHTIGGQIVIDAGAYVVLARDKSGAVAAKVPASAIAYEYGAGLASTDGILLANGASGTIAVHAGSVVIASVAYGGWFTESGSGGQSIELRGSSESGHASGWCLAPSAWASGADHGTPGAANDCP